MNDLKSIKIKNFKSINEIYFDCKRINIFLGEPNVGKSNILEALSLFSVPYCQLRPEMNRKTTPQFAWDHIRYSAIRNLFFFQDNSNPIKVITNRGVATLELTNPQQEQYDFYIKSDLDEIADNLKGFETLRIKPNTILGRLAPDFRLSFNKDGWIQTNADLLPYSGFIKKYSFNETYFRDEFQHNKSPYFLLPSYGSNVFTIVQGNHELADLVSGFFEKYDLEFIFIQEKSEYVIQRKKGRIGYQLPYDSIADTLQRIIFHLAAIYSNKDSVLLFEEPEAHNFPSYVNLLAKEIIDSKINQFFLTSHSPYLVETLVEKADANDIAVFMCTYKDHQTNIRELTSDELSDIKKYKYDLVYNIEKLKK